MGLLWRCLGRGVWTLSRESSLLETSLGELQTKVVAILRGKPGEILSATLKRACRAEFQSRGLGEISPVALVNVLWLAQYVARVGNYKSQGRMLPDNLTSYSSFLLEILSEGQVASLLREFKVPLGTVVLSRNNIAGQLQVCEDPCSQHRGRRGWKWQPMAAEPQPLSPHVHQRLPQEGKPAPGSAGVLRRRLDREDWVAVVRGDRHSRPLVEGNHQDMSDETTPIECDECFREIRELLEDEVSPLERTKYLTERVVAMDTQGLKF